MTRHISAAVASVAMSVLFLWPDMASAKQPEPRPEANDQFTVNFTFYKQDERRWAPFILHRGSLLLQVKVRGELVWAILDNGAASSALDSGFVKKHDIAVARTLNPYQTVTGAVQRRLTEAIEIDLPGLLKVSSPLSAVDLSHISKIIGKPVKVILGREYFQQTAVIIAFKNGLLNIGPASALKFNSSGSQADMLSVSLEGNAPLVSLSVNGKAVKVKLDTGFDGDLSLIPDVWDKAIRDDSVTDFVGSMSLEGTARAVLQARDQTVILAGQTLKNANVRRSSASTDSQDGLLGLGLLSRFDAVVINMADRRMTLIPKPPPQGS